MAQVQYNAAPTVAAEGGGGQLSNVRADAADFGGQIGGALQNAGKTAEQVGGEQLDFATQAAHMATEAKTNDIYAQKLAPAWADAHSAYSQLSGMDKFNAYPGYVDSLNKISGQYVNNATSPLEQQLLSGLVTRHVTAEIDSARREADVALQQGQSESHGKAIIAGTGFAAQNYNNPDVVNSYQQQNAGLRQIQGMNDGQSQDQIDQNIHTDTGDLGAAVIRQAVRTGDTNTAVNLRQQYGPFLPAHQQLTIDGVIHTQATAQTADQNVSALMLGNPLPPAVGSPTPDVRATVVKSAQAQDVDPNKALTYAHIESRDGTDLGARGTIGQDKESAGKPVEFQADTMTANIKKADANANAAVSTQGRQADPWEGYLCYQQGAGGGPALLKANAANPNARAVDVLAPLYGSPKTALQAIQGNGGNASMSVGDFCNFIKTKYSQNEQRAQCDFTSAAQAQQTADRQQQQDGVNQTNIPSADQLQSDLQNNAQQSNFNDIVSSEADKSQKDLASVITAPHETTGPAVQAASTPMGLLRNWNDKYPAMLQRANGIANINDRNATIEYIEKQGRIYSTAASAYKSNLISSAMQIAVKPDFTDINQLPADTRAAIMEDTPQTMTALEAYAKRNLQSGGGTMTKDQEEYGSGFYDAFKGVHSGAINDVTQLQGRVGDKGDLTVAGYEKLVSEMTGKGTPEGAAETSMKAQTFKIVKDHLSGEDDGLGIKDPEGEKNFGSAQPLIFKAIADGKAKGIPINELYDPKNKNWVGNAAMGLKRSPTEMYKDINSATAAAGAVDNSPTETLKAPPAMQTRVVGQVYNTPKGPLTWTANGWVK